MKDASLIKRWLRVGQVLLMVGLVIGMAVFLVKNREAWRFSGEQVSLHLFVLCGFSLLAHLGLSGQFHLVLRRFGAGIPFAGSLWAFTAGRAINVMIPQGGNAYRAVWLREHYGLSIGAYLQSFVVFTWLDMVFLLLLATAAAWGGGALPEAMAWQIGLPLAALGALVLTFALARMNFSRCVPAALRPWVSRWIQPLGLVLGDRSLLLRVSLLSVVKTLGHVVRLSAAFALFGVSPEVMMLLLFVGLSRVLMVVTITPGNIGVMEFFFGLLAESAGVGLETGLLVALVARAANYGALLISALGAALARPGRGRVLVAETDRASSPAEER